MSISYGRLLIVGREGAPEVEFPLDKKLVLIGRYAARPCGGTLTPLSM